MQRYPFGLSIRPWAICFAVLLVSLAALPDPLQAEEVHLAPNGLKPLDVFRDCDHCPEMIVMPPGSFMMGAIPGESRNPFDFFGRLDGTKKSAPRLRGPGEVNIIPNEHPRHRVEMDIPYAIARNETTQAEWMACVKDGGCTHVPDHRAFTPNGYKPLGPSHPVIDVSYLDAKEYVTWLNKKVGEQLYRLPTEAEWEYAARAGTTTPFAQGDALTADQANFSREATEFIQRPTIPMPELQDRWEPVPVDELEAANPWGVRHMSGNVQELTQSCFSEEHLRLPRDSAYLAQGDAQRSCRRVGKGGSYNDAMDNLRPARRFRPPEDLRRDYLGFRVVRMLGK